LLSSSEERWISIQAAKGKKERKRKDAPRTGRRGGEERGRRTARFAASWFWLLYSGPFGRPGLLVSGCGMFTIVSTSACYLPHLARYRVRWAPYRRFFAARMDFGGFVCTAGCGTGRQQRQRTARGSSPRDALPCGFPFTRGLTRGIFLAFAWFWQIPPFSACSSVANTQFVWLVGVQPWCGVVPSLVLLYLLLLAVVSSVRQATTWREGARGMRTSAGLFCVHPVYVL